MADLYVGQIIEETRRALYSKIEEFNHDRCCLGRLAGLAIIPINALALVANVLAVVIDTILCIWDSFKDRGCSKESLIHLIFLPIRGVMEIPVTLIEGTLGIIYDLVVPIIMPIKWAHQRAEYHATICAEAERHPHMVNIWASSICHVNILLAV